MATGLERLRAEVAEMRGAANSATAALTAVPGLIREAVASAIAKANGDAAVVEQELNVFADELDAAQAGLAAAIQANPGPTDPGGDTVAGPDTQTGQDSQTAGEDAPTPDQAGDALTPPDEVTSTDAEDEATASRRRR